jgi:hypothetical protein
MAEAAGEDGREDAKRVGGKEERQLNMTNKRMDACDIMNIYHQFTIFFN